MNQNLFSDNNTQLPINIPDGSLTLFPQFFNTEQADSYFNQLISGIDWKQEKISFYGKTHNVPRLSAWYGETGLSYEYSGIRAKAIPWHPALLEIKHKIESVTEERLNSVLVNLYRNGNDGVAWHSDNEPELGPDPVIASVTYGEERQFQLKHRTQKSLKKSFVLPHGSLLLMGNKTQLNWLHQIPKSKRLLGPRINLTYRYIV